MFGTMPHHNGRWTFARMALVGNTGGSLAPHLHFHIANGPRLSLRDRLFRARGRGRSCDADEGSRRRGRLPAWRRSEAGDARGVSSHSISTSSTSRRRGEGHVGEALAQPARYDRSQSRREHPRRSPRRVARGEKQRVACASEQHDGNEIDGETAPYLAARPSPDVSDVRTPSPPPTAPSSLDSSRSQSAEAIPPLFGSRRKAPPAKGEGKVRRRCSKLHPSP